MSAPITDSQPAPSDAAAGFFLQLPQRPKPEAPAGTVGLNWDAYSGAQMLVYGRECSDAALAASRAPADSVQDLHLVHDAVTVELLNERVAYLESKLAAADSNADPLQGAANWLAQAHGNFCHTVLQGCLMIGYNRAKRLHDAAIAARKQGASHE